MKRWREKKIEGLADQVIRRQSDSGRRPAPRFLRKWRDSRYYRRLGSVPSTELLAAVARRRINLPTTPMV